MAYNGSGVFQITTTGQPVVDGTTIDSSDFNDLTADLASGLSNCLTKDGQQTVTANIPMATYKFTGLGLGTSATDSARVDNANAVNMCEGRLTLESGVAVSTTDQTAKETLYFTPFRGNCIALYDGTNWYRRTFTELSIDVPDVTGVHDVFCYDNSGTPALEVLAWTNDTTRATALTLQNGVLVKTGATTRRYLGTFYSTTAGNGQIEDSAANRYLWNYYNRVARPMRVIEATASWTYSTATWRQANAATTNQLNFVIGVSEDEVIAEVSGAYSNSGGAGIRGLVGIGLDLTNAFHASCLVPETVNPATGVQTGCRASIRLFPGVGKHYLSWLEYSGATATGTFYGAVASVANSGIHGTVWG